MINSYKYLWSHFVSTLLHRAWLCRKITAKIQICQLTFVISVNHDILRENKIKSLWILQITQTMDLHKSEYYIPKKVIVVAKTVGMAVKDIDVLFLNTIKRKF